MNMLSTTHRSTIGFFALLCCTGFLVVAATSGLWSSHEHSTSYQQPFELRARKMVHKKQSPATIWIDNTIRYQLSNPESSEEYAHLVPPSGTTIRLRPDDNTVEPAVYTVALFHQLKCLDIIRIDYVNNQTSKLSQHCLNYLRQSILCLADTRLESVRYSRPPHLVSLAGDYVCKDWTVVYNEARLNQLS